MSWDIYRRLGKFLDTWDGMGWFGMFGVFLGGALGPFGKFRTF